MSKMLLESGNKFLHFKENHSLKLLFAAMFMDLIINNFAMEKIYYISPIIGQLTLFHKDHHAADVE